MRLVVLVPVLFIFGCISPPPADPFAPTTPDAGDGDADITVPRDGGPDADDLNNSNDATLSDVGADGGADADSGRLEMGTRDAAADMDSPDAQPDIGAPRYRVPITIPAGTVTESIAAFPLLLDFVIPTIPTGAPRTRDLSFVDAQGNVFPWDLEAHTADGRLLTWVLVPLDPNAAFTFFLDFEGRPNSSSDVWSEYNAVWHFVQPIQAGEYRDASGNNNKLTPVGNPTTTQGQIGNAVAFDGQGARYTAPGATLESPTFTISLWAWVPDSTVDYTLLTKPIATDTRESYQLGAEPPGMWVELTYAGNLYQRYHFPYPKGAWYHVSYTFDGAVMRWQVNGTAGAYSVPVSGDIPYDGSDLLLGADADNGVADNFLDGRLDEVRFAPSVLSPARLDAERRNQANPSDFFTVGQPEEY